MSYDSLTLGIPEVLSGRIQPQNTVRMHTPQLDTLFRLVERIDVFMITLHYENHRVGRGNRCRDYTTLLGYIDWKDQKHGEDELRVTGQDFPEWQRKLHG